LLIEPGLRKIVYFDFDAKQKKQKYRWKNYRVQYLIFLVNKNISITFVNKIKYSHIIMTDFLQFTLSFLRYRALSFSSL